MTRTLTHHSPFTGNGTKLEKKMDVLRLAARQTAKLLRGGRIRTGHHKSAFVRHPYDIRLTQYFLPHRVRDALGGRFAGQPNHNLGCYLVAHRPQS